MGQKLSILSFFESRCLCIIDYFQSLFNLFRRPVLNFTNTDGLIQNFISVLLLFNDIVKVSVIESIQWINVFVIDLFGFFEVIFFLLLRRAFSL